MSELNREQIKKELEELARFTTCPEYIKDALSLIKELTEENERLKAQRYMLYSDGKLEMIPTVESVRADTVREFSERLKNYYSLLKGVSYPGLVAYHIDIVAQEFLEGGTDGKAD